MREPYILPRTRGEIPLRSMSKHGIVLDIDETLVHTFTDINKAFEFGVFEDPVLRSRAFYIELTDVSAEKGIGEKSRLWGVVRPHAEEFLQFCFSFFKVVGVWSAGKKEYVESVVELLFRDICPPNFVYTFDDCHKEGPVYSKPLEKLFRETNLGDYVSPGHVFFLDDRADVCKYNPLNAVILPPYIPQSLCEIMRDDDTLLRLISWFMQPGVWYCDDVRKLRKDVFRLS